MINWSIDELIDWWIDWLFNWLSDDSWLVDGLISTEVNMPSTHKGPDFRDDCKEYNQFIRIPGTLQLHICFYHFIYPLT